MYFLHKNLTRSRDMRRRAHRHPRALARHIPRHTWPKPFCQIFAKSLAKGFLAKPRYARAFFWPFHLPNEYPGFLSSFARPDSFHPIKTHNAHPTTAAANKQRFGARGAAEQAIKRQQVSVGVVCCVPRLFSATFWTLRRCRDGFWSSAACLTRAFFRMPFWQLFGQTFAKRFAKWRKAHLANTGHVWLPCTRW